MNKEIIYYKNKAIVSTDKELKAPIDCYDNLADVLIQENKIERIENEISQLDEQKKELDNNKKLVVAPLIFVATITSLLLYPAYLIAKKSNALSEKTSKFYNKYLAAIVGGVTVASAVKNAYANKNITKQVSKIDNKKKELKYKLRDEKEILNELKECEECSAVYDDYHIVDIEFLEEQREIEKNKPKYITLKRVKND